MTCNLCNDCVSSLCSVLQTPAEGSRVSDKELKNQQVCDMDHCVTQTFSFSFNLAFRWQKQFCSLEGRHQLLVHLIPEIASVWKKTGKQVFCMLPGLTVCCLRDAGCKQTVLSLMHADTEYVAVGCSVKQTDVSCVRNKSFFNKL